MDKPATMLYREFRQNLLDAVNGSKLPACALIPIMEQALAELKVIDDKQYEADKAAYEGDANGENNQT